MFEGKTAVERRQHAKGRRDGFNNEAPASNEKPAYAAGYREGMLERMSSTRDERLSYARQVVEAMEFVSRLSDGSRDVDRALEHLQEELYKTGFVLDEDSELQELHGGTGS